MLHITSHIAPHSLLLEIILYTFQGVGQSVIQAHLPSCPVFFFQRCAQSRHGVILRQG